MDAFNDVVRFIFGDDDDAEGGHACTDFTAPLRRDG